MQNKSNLKKKIACLLAASVAIAPLSVFAKEINLFDQPTPSAKSVGKVDLAAGIVSIFTTDKGDWIKVGDPRNGNTGWVKAADLEKAENGPGPVAYNQQVITDANGNQSFYFQFGGRPQPMSAEQQKKMVQAMRDRERAMQAEFRRSMHQMSEHFRMMEQDFPMMWGDNMPMMPVVFVPVEKKQIKTAEKPAPVVADKKAAEKA